MLFYIIFCWILASFIHKHEPSPSECLFDEFEHRVAYAAKLLFTPIWLPIVVWFKFVSYTRDRAIYYYLKFTTKKDTQ